MYSSSQGLAFVASVVLSADSSAERKLHRPMMKTHLRGLSQLLQSELTFLTLTDEVVTAGDVVAVSPITPHQPWRPRDAPGPP